jgi:hypothetical protein
MIFAVYKGNDPKLTQGKIYLGSPAMDSADIMDASSFTITDDTGCKQQVDRDSGKWEYLPKVYAVIVKEFAEFAIGDVTLIDDATITLSMERTPDTFTKKVLLSPLGFTFRDSSYFVLLDRTNLFPGLCVADGITGDWKEVLRIDEALWIAVDPDGVQRSPTEFRFAVADGEIMARPMITCIDDTGEPRLTKGNHYFISRSGLSGVWLIEDDTGKKNEYFFARFRMG